MCAFSMAFIRFLSVKKKPQEFLLWHNRLAAFLEHMDTGLIPSPAQWAKDPALLQLWYRSQLWLISDPWPRNSVSHQVAKKEKNKTKQNKNKYKNLGGVHSSLS